MKITYFVRFEADNEHGGRPAKNIYVAIDMDKTLKSALLETIELKTAARAAAMRLSNPEVITINIIHFEP